MKTRKCRFTLALCFIATHQAALAEQKFFFDLPAGPVSQALRQYGKQSKVDVLFDPNLRGTSRRVHGRFTKKKALVRLLSETRLEPRYVSEVLVYIIEPPLPPPPPSAPPNDPEVTISAVPPPPTGSNIPEEPVIQPIIYGQMEIRDSGASTVPEFLRKLTQTFGGGPSEDTLRQGRETKSNTTFAQSINLRGLGSRATLILINGRRIAPSGSDASFVDVSLIPLSFIDHIEVLLEGASATYGSDAVGGVINLITKDNFTKKSYQGEALLAEGGGDTTGSQFEYRTSGWWGKDWGSGNVFVSAELYHRGALAASARPYATSDLRRFGEMNLDTPESNPGTLTSGGQNYPIPAGSNKEGLDFARLLPGDPNLSDRYLNAQILPSQDQRSFFGGLHQSIGTHWTVFGTFLWSDRHAIEAQGDQRLTSPVPSSTPFILNQPADLTIEYDLADDIGIWTNDARVRAINFTLGTEVKLWSDWVASIAAVEVVENEYQKTLGTADQGAVYTAMQSTLNLFGSGANIDSATLKDIRVEPKYHSKSELREFYGSIHGHLLNIPAGAISAAYGTELRYQRFASDLSPPPMGSNLTRGVLAGFGEINIPIFGPKFRIPGFDELRISGLVRFEHYSDIGASTTPHVGVKWRPLSWITLQGTWGRSFRAPNPGDLDEHSNVAFIQTFADASAPGGFSEALVVSGKNSRLHAERAVTGTAGITLEPPILSGFKAGVGFSHTIFEDRIQTTEDKSNLLNNPDAQFVVTRNPSNALRDAICLDRNNHFASSTLDGMATDCQSTPIGSFVDLRTLNLETLHLEALDFSASYGFESSWGHIALDLQSTYLLDYSLVNMPGAPRLSVLNTEHNPINLQAKGDIKWQWHDAWVRLGANYANSYRNIESTPPQNIGPWLTFDLQLGYRLHPQAGDFRDIDIILNIQNVGDRDPPFTVNQSASLGYDQENGDPYGRMLKLTIQMSLGGPSRD